MYLTPLNNMHKWNKEVHNAFVIYLSENGWHAWIHLAKNAFVSEISIGENSVDKNELSSAAS